MKEKLLLQNPKMVNGKLMNGFKKEYFSFRVNDKKIIGGPYNAWNDFQHLQAKQWMD